MSRSIVTAMALGLLVGAACKKNSDTSAKQDPTSQPPQTPPASDPQKTASADASPGVEAGGIERDASQGAAATFASVTGTVEVRRAGETQWAAAAADTKLYSGDTVRTGESSTATLALADESTVEVAEVSTVAVGSRAGTADPGSSAAVLGGLARFTVTPRTPGEGAFRVYTSSGVVLTRGTTYGVGVAASGEARIGVESGAVDVIGIAQLDATPIKIEKSQQITLAAEGKVGSPAPWPADDWGTWRDEAEATVQVGATVEAHGKMLAELDQALVDGYAELATTADAVATFEAQAAASAEAGDSAAYTAAQPEGAATIDASFSLAGRLEALTWANAARANLATELYVRHPKDVETHWQVVGPRVDTAILWPKRFEITAIAFFEPLRTQYYVHHPRGRMHATLVGVTVPQFFAAVEPQPVDPAVVRTKVKGQIWVAPDLSYKPSRRPVWVAAPAADWHAKLKIKPAPARAKVGWYVRPATLKSTAMFGGKVTGTWQSKLAVKPPQPQAALAATWKVPVGMKVKLAPPDLSAAATARTKIKLGADGRLVRDHRMGATGKVQGAAGATAGLKGKATGKLDVKAPDVNVKAPDVKGKVGVAVGAGAGGAAAAGGTARAAGGVAVGAGANMKTKVDGAVKAGATVKPPAVKPPAVKVKGEVKAKGSFKLGN